ncbi:MAG TPA: hypothetical protein VJU87_01750 [Gemmatimonadaceae bacterium]|nr:hypothetical protein [Gemmatimonadaceae bacterium]
MSQKESSTPTLLDLFRRAMRRHTGAPDAAPSIQRDGGDAIVSRRDERGVPYKGDVPNPTRGTYRDCF